MKSARAIGVVVASLAMFGAGTALACGYCVEDRIAAVYDHALSQRTLQSRQQLAYFAWDGPLVRDEASRQKMLVLGDAVPGVIKGSVRVSMEPAAIAVAFDPRSSSGASIAAALQKKVGLLKVSLVPLQAPQPTPSGELSASRAR